MLLMQSVPLLPQQPSLLPPPLLRQLLPLPLLLLLLGLCLLLLLPLLPLLLQWCQHLACSAVLGCCW
jgi:hypothetical protein